MQSNKSTIASLVATVLGEKFEEKQLPKVHSDSYGNRSKYSPHQGAGECARRRRQMERGQT